MKATLFFSALYLAAGISAAPVPQISCAAESPSCVKIWPTKAKIDLANLHYYHEDEKRDAEPMPQSSGVPLARNVEERDPRYYVTKPGAAAKAPGFWQLLKSKITGKPLTRDVEKRDPRYYVTKPGAAAKIPGFFQLLKAKITGKPLTRDVEKRDPRYYVTKPGAAAKIPGFWQLVKSKITGKPLTRDVE